MTKQNEPQIKSDGKDDERQRCRHGDASNVHPERRGLFDGARNQGRRPSRLPMHGHVGRRRRRSEPVINPKPAPHFDKSKQIPTRFVFCKNYDLCLDFSIARCWDSFTCNECSHYEIEKRSPQKWLEDNLWCLDLIETLYEMGRWSQ